MGHNPCSLVNLLVLVTDVAKLVTKSRSVVYILPILHRSKAIVVLLTTLRQEADAVHRSVVASATLLHLVTLKEIMIISNLSLL